jgi:hypothetical protein
MSKGAHCRASLHALNEVFSLLDGGFQLRNGVGDHLLLERADFADAQVLLQALFLEDRGEEGD